MSYSFTKSSLVGTTDAQGNPKDQYIGLFQETLNEQFYNSSDWWTISEQVEAGSTVFNEVDVRINHVINAETGLKLGDDWKTILFKNIDHNISLGKQYVFDDNVWVTINTEKLKNLTGTCTVRRCNNTLRWIDEPTGEFYEEPCIIDYLVKEPRNYSTSGSPFMTPGGFLHIEMQFNATSNKIKQNQRFLFGNAGHWTCYKVIGTGLNDFRNEVTFDNTSAKLLVIDLIADFVNEELDDVVRGIADVNTNVYTITLNKDTASGIPTETVQLTAEVTYNGDTTTRVIEWESSNTNIATVSTSGLVTLKAVGTCTITANIKNNPAQDTCAITVSNTPSVNSHVTVTPNSNYILEGKTISYSVYLFENDIQQVDTFTITCNANTVPASSFVFAQVDGNHFSLKNIKRDVSSYLTITCVSGTITKTFDIFLRGGW